MLISEKEGLEGKSFVSSTIFLEREEETVCWRRRQRRRSSGSLVVLFAVAFAGLISFEVASACNVQYTSRFNFQLNCSDPIDLFNFDKDKLRNVTQLLVQCGEIWTQPASLPPLDGLQLFKLKNLKIQNCGIEAVRMLSNIKHSGYLTKLDLSNNKLEELEWQLARKFKAHELNLSNNNIECSCTNKWVYDFQLNTNNFQRNVNNTLIANFLELPSTVRLFPYDDYKMCRAECPSEEVELQPPVINTTLSAMATLKCKMRGSQVQHQTNFDPEDLFRWPAGTEEARAERRKRWKVVKEAPNIYRMEIWNLTSDDLGIVICECLECVQPKYAQSEFRFETMISSKVEIDHDMNHLIIHGYPLKNLTMTMTLHHHDKNKSNETETRELVVKRGMDPFARFFNNTVDVRYNTGHSFTSLKYYDIQTKVDTILANYTLVICTPRKDDCVNHTVELGKVKDPTTYFSPDPPSGTSTFAYLFFGLLVLGGLGALLLSTFHYYRRDKTASKLATAVGWHKKGRFRRISRNTTKTEETSLRMDDTLSATLSNYSLQHVPVIDKDHLVLEEKIGKGAFGEVFIGEWTTRGARVAVKILHNVQIDAQMDKEAALLSALDHDNVVKMYGVCRAFDTQSLYLVLELMNMGDLKTYVKQREPRCDNYSQFPPALLNTELINIAQQICGGLCYIHMQQIVHRDFAARNCLVSGESDLRVCAAAFRPPITVKISDFGMSRRLYSQAEYYKMGDKKTALPVRWLPPECLESGRFTYQSDMWAFGITLYELFTFGAMPYGDLSNNEALMAVISGMRPTVPKCPPEIAEIMKECWKTAPDERPSADETLIRLRMIQ